MIAIFKREFKAYFSNMMGYVFAAFVLLMVGIYVTVMNFQSGYPGFEYVLSGVTFVFLVIVPILTMRVLAEEKHQKTDQLLYALPMKTSSVAIGKYLALLAVYAMPIVLMLVYPLIISRYGTINMAISYSTIGAFLLLGAALISIGMFISSLTESQIIAAIVSFGTMLLAYLMDGIADLISGTALASLIAFSILTVLVALFVFFMTKNIIISAGLGVLCEAGVIVTFLVSSASFEGLFGKVLRSMSLFDRFTNFVYGIFDCTAIVYYISIAVMFVFLSVQSLEKKRWS